MSPQTLRPDGDCLTSDVGTPDTDFVTAPWWSKLDDESDATLISAALIISHPLVGRFCVAMPTMDLPDVAAPASDYILRIRIRSVTTSEILDAPNFQLVEGSQQTTIQALLNFSDNPLNLTTSFQDFVVLGTALPGDWATADLTNVAFSFSGSVSIFPGTVEIARLEIEIPSEALICSIYTCVADPTPLIWP